MGYQSAQQLEELAAFVAVVNANGFTAAAQAAGARKATLSQRVKELESRLGVSLLVRTTRSLRLTEEGRAYFEHAHRCMAAAKEADAVIARAKAQPSGMLRITLSASLAATLFEDVVTRYLHLYPDVSIEIDTSTSFVDLAREGFDLAIRVGALLDSSLVTRRLGMAAGGYYASPLYLKKRGVPQHPDELRTHATIAIPRHEGPQEWQFVIAKKTRSTLIRPRILVDGCEMAIRAATTGLGIVHAPTHFAEPYLKSRALVPILEEYTPPRLQVSVVYAPGAAAVPKTRTFLDLLSEWFAKHGGEV